MKSDFPVRALVLSLAAFFQRPIIEIRVSDSNAVQDYKDRISRISGDYEALKSKYESLGRDYAQECQINIRLQDELKESRLKK